MSYYADPDSYGSCSGLPDAQLRRDAAILDLLSPAAPVADRLRAEASSSASRCAESRLSTPADGSATRRGPAVVASE